MPPRYANPSATGGGPVFRGVSFDALNELWRARLYWRGRHLTLGRFATATQAAFAHDRAAVYVLGAEASTNFGVEAARRSNESSAPIASARVMETLEALRVERQGEEQQLAAAATTGASTAHTQEWLRWHARREAEAPWADRSWQEWLRVRREAAAAAVGVAAPAWGLPPAPPPPPPPARCGLSDNRRAVGALIAIARRL